MKTDQSGYPRVFLLAAFLIVFAGALYVAVHIYDPLMRPVLDVLPPFVIAFVFAFLLDPVVDWFQRRGLSRGMGVLVVGVLFLVAFVLLGFLIVPKVADQAARLAGNFPDYLKQAQDQLDSLLERAKPLLRRLHLPYTAGELSSKYSSQIGEAAKRSFSLVSGVLTAGLSKVLWIIIVPLSTLWLLRDLEYIKAKVVHFTPPSHREKLMRVSAAVGDVFGKYVRGMVAVSVLFSAVASAVLSIAGLDYALIIGGVSGLLYQIPYIGTLVMVIVTGIAALVQPGHGIGYALILMGIMGALGSVIFDLLVTPKVVGGSVGVHPLLTLFSLMLGAQLFGILGMIIAVPVAASLQVALAHFYPQILDDVRPKDAAKKPKQPRKPKRHG
jgi:predicted PurR-regulated permease PerM